MRAVLVVLVACTEIMVACWDCIIASEMIASLQPSIHALHASRMLAAGRLLLSLSQRYWSMLYCKPIINNSIRLAKFLFQILITDSTEYIIIRRSSEDDKRSCWCWVLIMLVRSPAQIGWIRKLMLCCQSDLCRRWELQFYELRRRRRRTWRLRAWRRRSCSHRRRLVATRYRTTRFTVFLSFMAPHQRELSVVVVVVTVATRRLIRLRDRAAFAMIRSWLVHDRYVWQSSRHRWSPRRIARAEDQGVYIHPVVDRWRHQLPLWPYLLLVTYEWPNNVTNLVSKTSERTATLISNGKNETFSKTVVRARIFSLNL